MLIRMSQYLPEHARIFEFTSRTYEEGNPDITFTYTTHFESAEPLVTTETITLTDRAWATKIPKAFREAMLDDLHLVLGVSYYKLFCAPTFKTDIALSDEQAHFWNTLYAKGLGEFLYRNNLSPEIVARFSGGGDNGRTCTALPVDETSVLVGIGGGKDSIVSLELLRDVKRTGFVVATADECRLTDAVLHIAGVPSVVVRRALDANMLRGIAGSYNGHVPISAVYAFLGVFGAALRGDGYFVVSNEHSSNFGNLMHEGNEINHKWSGSVEFETRFVQYVRTYLTPSVRYFSLTRPFYELRVVKLFTKLGKDYFHAFSSCNRNFAHTHDGQTKWCGVCPKCAFSFLMLAAFLSKEEVVSIFNKNLFEDESLLPLFKDLLGFGAMKPFDCVGTFDESRVALDMAAKNGWEATRVVRELVPLLSGVVLSTEVFKVQQSKTVPSRFRMLGMESALVLGYGKEGHATEQYLKAVFPHVHVGVADERDGDEYLDKQHVYDIVLKTPVIPGERVTRHYTTATNLFFGAIPRKNIIGVTGSKGKSTTSTLIYEMLKKGGKPVRLVGNIGVPALLEILERPPLADELFVFELSSYQLADLDMSPHIAVVTSLFPEHLDYHGSLEAYYDAKRNITRHQSTDDAFIYAHGFPLLETWAKETNSETLAGASLPFSVTNMSLRGEHMHSNVALAYTVARIYGVDEHTAERVVEEFQGLPHRLMHVGTYKGVAFYDDSISTTPESTIAALRGLEHVHTILLGGVDRGLDFKNLDEELRAHSVKTIILFPDTGERMLASEDGYVVLHTKDMDEAVAFAYEHTLEGETVLLSPASPSYNLFTNFEARGQAFIDAVKKYGDA